MSDTHKYRYEDHKWHISKFNNLLKEESIRIK